MATLDTNGDKGGDASEVAARVNSWQATPVGLTGIKVKVTLDGQPLSQAPKSTLEPDRCLGDDINGCERATGIMATRLRDSAREPPVAEFAGRRSIGSLHGADHENRERQRNDSRHATTRRRRSARKLLTTTRRCYHDTARQLNPVVRLEVMRPLGIKAFRGLAND